MMVSISKLSSYHLEDIFNFLKKKDLLACSLVNRAFLETVDYILGRKYVLVVRYLEIENYRTFEDSIRLDKSVRERNERFACRHDRETRTYLSSSRRIFSEIILYTKCSEFAMKVLSKHEGALRKLKIRGGGGFEMPLISQETQFRRLSSVEVGYYSSLDNFHCKLNAATDLKFEGEVKTNFVQFFPNLKRLSVHGSCYKSFRLPPIKVKSLLSLKVRNPYGIREFLLNNEVKELTIVEPATRNFPFNIFEQLLETCKFNYVEVECETVLSKFMPKIARLFKYSRNVKKFRVFDFCGEISNENFHEWYNGRRLNESIKSYYKSNW